MAINITYGNVSGITDPEDFYNVVTSEIYAESFLSYNPGQRQHLGKIVLKSMRRHPYDALLQIDASNNEQESVGSVLERSINTANAMRSFGVKVGDVVALMGRNHLDACLPFYASFFLGAAFMGIDNTLKTDELKAMLSIGKPKLLFCEVENLETVSKLKDELNLEVITFAGNEHFTSFAEFIQKYKTYEPTSAFRPAEYDPEKTTALIAFTSGSSGLPKAADITHSNLAPYLPQLWTSKQADYGGQTRLALSLAPLSWLPAASMLLRSAVFCICRLHTSAPLSTGHLVEIIKKYKPTWSAMSPALAANLLKTPEALDWTCFETFGLWGAPVPDGVATNINKLIGKNAVTNGYGLTEASGLVFYSHDENNVFGTSLPHFEVKLVNAESTKEVTGNGSGELWLKGPSIIKGYYNEPDSTKDAFSEDGWFKTRDLFQRNNDKLSYVERLGENFKYGDSHISALEIEQVLLRLEGVSEAAVVGVPHQMGALPFAGIVANAEHNLTVEHVVDFVRENLSDCKHLRGGVMFVGTLPLTPSGKLDRKHLQLQAIDYYNNTQKYEAQELNGVQRISYTTIPRKKIFCCC